MPVDLLALVAAALAGLLGGAHCAAMCGGIATGFSALSGRGGWWRAMQPNLGFSATTGVRLWQWLRPLQRRLLLATDSSGKRIALGMLWGWMPCGLSTTLLAAAWLQASALNGALTMAAFGLGTLPLMLPLTWSGARLGQRLLRGRWRNAAAALVLVAGVVTLASPWLMQHPALHGVLAALGCVPRHP